MKREIFVCITISICFFVVFCKFDIDNTKIDQYKDLLNATISIGSIGVGFLAAAITLLPSHQENSFLESLKEIGGYTKLLDALLIGIATLFLTCLLSIFGLFLNLDSEAAHMKFYFYIWLLLFVFTMSYVVYIISLFAYYLRSAGKHS